MVIHLEIAKQVDELPINWGLRLIYADALEDAGENEEAEIQRWLFGIKKAPIFYPLIPEWCWWGETRYDEVLQFSHYLCPTVFDKLEHGKPDKRLYCRYKSYDTRREAEHDLWKLKPIYINHIVKEVLTQEQIEAQLLEQENDYY